MLDVQIDVTAHLGFALQRGAADRVNFAMRFKRLDDCDEGLHWGAVKSLVEAVDVPAGVPEKDWEGALDLFVQDGLKKTFRTRWRSSMQTSRPTCRPPLRLTTHGCRIS